jgi:nicotinate-nucleotide adenylyltransferase
MIFQDLRSYIINIQLNNSWNVHCLPISPIDSTIPHFQWDNLIFQFSMEEFNSERGEIVPWEKLVPETRQKIILIHSYLWRGAIPFATHPSHENQYVTIPPKIKEFLAPFHFEAPLHQGKLFQENTEWCFFGGTFNPWHPGHSACISLCEAPHIFILPDNNPLKMINRPLAESLTDMWRQEELKLKGIPYLGFVANYLPNPTFPWMQKIRESHPQKILSLLVGMDSFVYFEKWFKAEQLIKILNKFYVVPRSLDDLAPNDPSVWAKNFQESSDWMKAINNQLEIQLLPHHPFEKISSTELRKKLTART